jgi:hypothetical protein
MTIRHLVSVLVVAICCIAAIDHVLAQTLPAPTDPGGIDFGPTAVKIIEVVASALGVALTVLSGFAVRWVASKASISDQQAEALAAARVNEILHLALDYAEAWSKARVADPSSPIRSVKFDNMFLDIAMRYAKSSMPELIDRFKMTDDRIKDMLLTRLNRIMATPAENSGSVEPVDRLNAGVPE